MIDILLVKVKRESEESEQEGEEVGVLGGDVGNLLLLLGEDVGNLLLLLGGDVGNLLLLLGGDVGNLLRYLLSQIDAVGDLFEAIDEVEQVGAGLRQDLLWLFGLKWFGASGDQCGWSGEVEEEAA